MRKSIIMTCIALFLCISAGAVMAGDKEDLQNLYKDSTRKIDRVIIAGTWSMVSWMSGDNGGMDLRRKIDGKWQYIMGGGGAIGLSDLHQYGVPQDKWNALLHYTPPEEQVSEALKRDGPYWKEETAGRKLTERDLEAKSTWELALMRNEIYARYGRAFLDPYLQSYFKSRKWYKISPSFNEKMLTSTERYNAEFILKFQKKSNRI
jgi:hypothetical protein